VARLRQAAVGHEPMDARTGLLLSMTGPAKLLGLVAPARAARRHARNRIDHAVDGTDLASVANAVRKVIADGEAAMAAGA
jgi:hypothetical protein